MCPEKNRKKNACRRIASGSIRTITQAAPSARNNMPFDQDTEESIKLRFLVEVMLGFTLILSVHAWLLFILYLLYSTQ
jgi:hypothetical protein